MTTKAIEAGARAEIVAAMQHAIMKHPFFKDNSVTAFGFASVAFEAVVEIADRSEYAPEISRVKAMLTAATSNGSGK